MMLTGVTFGRIQNGWIQRFGNFKVFQQGMKTKLDFDEISNWREFENLVADYFREVKKKEKNIKDVQVHSSGEGSDGGRDIL